MIESKLTELLERAGERTNVGPPPIEAIRAGAARRRRRTAVLTVAGTAAAVVAVMMGGTVVLADGRSSTNPASPAASTRPVPAGMRLVGIGHAAIAVPKHWGTNQLRCYTPQQDTVVIDTGGSIPMCLAARPDGVDSVSVGTRKPFGFHAEETFQIDGVRAERQRTTCTDSINRVTVCSGAVSIPSLNVWFWAESSSSSGEVDRILDRIMIVPDKLGVPDRQLSGPNPPERYAARLTGMGLKPETRTRKATGLTPVGTLLAVSPSPGTMLAPGATVTLVVAGR